MTCEYTVVARALVKDTLPALPGLRLAEKGRNRSDEYRRHARPCGKPAEYYEIRGLVSLTTMWLCEEHRHDIGSLGNYSLALTIPPAAQPTEEPALPRPLYEVPPERA